MVLFVLGAIISFALEIDLPGIDGGTLGMILMAAGAVLFLIGLLLGLRSRRTVVSTRQDPHATVSEHRDPPVEL